MRAIIFRYFTILSLLIGVLVIVGCGLTPGSSSSSSYSSTASGADAGPWPQKPTKDAKSSPSDPQKAPLFVEIAAKVPTDSTLSLEVGKVELQCNEEWVTIANKEDINKIEPKAVLLNDKSSVALLVNTQIPVRKYTAMRISFLNAALKNSDEASSPIIIGEINQSLDDWAPTPSKNSLLTIHFDVSKITKDQDALKASAAAFSIQKATATGSIQGTVSPTTVGNVKVQVFWEKSTVLLGSAIPQTTDGSFTISNLPVGEYSVFVQADGYHLAKPISDLISVNEKAVTLGKLTLEKDQ
ncbi:MAG TPA: carboxypeptidase-like regulatory domain-containing protein [Armatimonadota bacterium]|nr:carboxypeptidase-like regulatory domain-containing protein [Armatimonadota bacterium]